MFSARKIERSTFEGIPFRFVACGLHPDHDTIANFRKAFLSEIFEVSTPVSRQLKRERASCASKSLSSCRGMAVIAFKLEIVWSILDKEVTKWSLSDKSSRT